ncbi:piggyBac transposable element-derived protein 4 [Nephila pilipes]|uniref:PiggyBac transposable element-derived protein 4 n=1 Tax=Nephila pilipes TaxID=299642 RepID=A0A8X6PI00_NEPPI|nr:piggyBac transposable element-derived protein 4 [Nephila pilipes]
MKGDSENGCFIEEESSDEEFSSSENETDDDCLDSARDWCQIDITFTQPTHSQFPFTRNPGIRVCLGDSGDSIEYFKMFFDDEMFLFIVRQMD